MAGGILTLLCLGGVGVFVSLYDEATEIKRDAPDAVLDNFLGAYLQDRDDEQAALYTCKSDANLTALETFRARFIAVEKEHGVGVSFAWVGVNVTTAANRGSAMTDVKYNASDGAHGLETFKFDLVDDDGWRVCGATQVS